MITHGRNIKVFTGNSHSQLAQDIADILGVPVESLKFQLLAMVKYLLILMKLLEGMMCS